MYAAKRFSCGPGAVSAPTKQFYTKLFFYNTVVLGRVVAQVVKTRLPRFKADPKSEEGTEVPPGNATV
jgi:hypothetical protein